MFDRGGFQHGKAHVGDVIRFKPSILQSQNVCTRTFAPIGVVTEVTYNGYHPKYTLQLAPLVVVTVTTEDCTKLVRRSDRAWSKVVNFYFTLRLNELTEVK